MQGPVIGRVHVQSVFVLAGFLACLTSARADNEVTIKGLFPDGASIALQCSDKGKALIGQGQFTSSKGVQRQLTVHQGAYSFSNGTTFLQGQVQETGVPFSVQGVAATGQITFNVGGPRPTNWKGQGEVVISDWSEPEVDQQLAGVLKKAGFTGFINEQIENRLRRRINPKLAETGRMLFFDSVLGLARDNSCAGCHSPLRGYGDTQAIAIGVGNNGVVGPGRTGPRNMRRTPMIFNSAFYPALMWNSRFVSLSGNPFDNRQGFQFPPPELRNLSYLPTLLTAQAFLPVTQPQEMAGFKFVGTHDQIRMEVLKQVNSVPAYRMLFASQFPSVFKRGPITFDMIAAAIAEFEYTLVRANAPIDQFARGNTAAMTRPQKQGALLFFGKAGCVNCHQVAGPSNEMFSDFRPHNIGVPQLVPQQTNGVFDGPNKNEDYGLESVTGNPADRYKFRTTPLRNVALQPWFFHDGAFTRLEDAIAHHLDVQTSVRKYTPVGQVPPDLAGPIAPMQPILATLDPLVAQPTALTEPEFHWLVEFVRFGLLDPTAVPDPARSPIPRMVPSGLPVPTFQ